MWRSLTSRRVTKTAVLILMLIGPLACGGAIGDTPTTSAPAPPSDAAFARSEAAEEFRTLAREATRFKEIQQAASEGFFLPGGRVEHPLMGEHWYRRDRMEKPFELMAPPSLQYATVGERQVFLGVSYVVYVDENEPTPEGFSGSWDQWHRHANRATLSSARARAVDPDAAGPMDTRDQVAMLHAWTELPSPDGPFAPVHRGLPYLRAGLDPELAESGTLAAAWGIALLDRATCRFLEDQLRRRIYLSDQDRAMLSGECVRAGQALASDLRTVEPGSAPAVNDLAERAWQTLDEAVLSALSQEQRTQLRRLGHVDRMEVPFGQRPRGATSIPTMSR